MPTPSPLAPLSRPLVALSRGGSFHLDAPPRVWHTLGMTHYYPGVLVPLATLATPWYVLVTWCARRARRGRSLPRWVVVEHQD